MIINLIVIQVVPIEHIIIIIYVKIVILILAAFGLAPMWLAVFGDTGVLILCVLNSMRTLRAKG